ncbi:outer membrane protein assembly factor BamB family protein [Saccharothrix deserti]|uniref:outer membrane protein assembly factor BamB family protein n=1 Tax=Saccharothrix deserti TaxID=2593674 RepID=UPI00131D44E3|nr:PQQ-binding-like beta-propeller repeat protein [Saccharothrix deserti]
MIEVRWERQLHQAGSDTGLAVAANGQVVVHERHTRLVCLDPVDGSVRWDIPVGKWLRALVATGRRCLVLPQDTDRLLCVDLDTGERVWSADLRGWTGHVVVAGDTVLVGGWRGYTPLRALDLATGQVLWETADCTHTVRPAAVEGRFLIGEPAGSSARLIDAREPRESSAWLLPQPLVDPDYRAAFTAAGRDRFLMRCGDHAVAEIVPSTGTVREFVLPGSDLTQAAPEYVDGRLWVSERRAGYVVVDLADGRVLHRIDVRQPLAGRAVPIGSGVVIAGTAGTLFRLGADGQVVERAAVARRIRALHALGPAHVLAVTKGTLLAAAVGNRE